MHTVKTASLLLMCVDITTICRQVKIIKRQGQETLPLSVDFQQTFPIRNDGEVIAFLAVKLFPKQNSLPTPDI